MASAAWSPLYFWVLFFLILLQHHSLRLVHCWAGPNSRKIWEMKKVVGWHHSINRHGFEQIPGEWRTRKPVMLQSMMLQRVGHDLATEQQHEVLPNMYYSHEASLTAQVLSPLPFLGFHEHLVHLLHLYLIINDKQRQHIKKQRHYFAV